MAVIPTKNEFARTPGGVTIPTSGEFVKVPDGGGGGVPLYSGTLTLASRPAAPGVFATLDAPNCTHFAMYAGDTPDYTTGKAFWGFAFVEKNQATFAIASNNAGTGVSSSAAGITCSFDAQTEINDYTNSVFGEHSIELSTRNVGDTTKLPQAGLDYKWFAW